MTEMRTVDRLTFVYRADTGKVNALLDSARKLLMINGCALCSITHGLAGEKGDFKSCREEIGVPLDFVHRNELMGPLAEVVGDRLPCVVAHAQGEMELLLDPEALERCRGSVNDFKGRLGMRAAMRRLEIPGLTASS